MKKRYILHCGAVIFLCGLVLQFSYEASGHAPWSILVASVNSSPWELIKPYLLVFIMWSFIELSCLRPRLLHFICARIISMHLFMLLGCTLLSVGSLRFFETYMLCIVFFCILTAQTAEYLLYQSTIRTELFFVPLMISFAAVFFCILFCSFYPPPFVFFRLTA